MKNQSDALNVAGLMPQYAVVIVDDEPDILQSLKSCFQREQYRVIYAGSGAEGIKLIAETPHVAVILSEQRMPDMKVSEFITRSRGVAPDAISMLLTGNSDTDTTVSTMNEGDAIRYISKPWEDSALLQTVRDAVRHYHLIMENRRQQEVINRQNRELRKLLCRITEQNDELERIASTDPLTGITNRRLFLEALESEIIRTLRYGGTLSLIMFDIDHFMQVNDTWGYATGDIVLREIAHETSNFLRKTDIAARYDGEKFIVLLPETNLTGVQTIANRLLLLVAEKLISQGDGPSIQVTISIGVATLRPDESGGTLIIRADRALQEAKHNGRNRVEVSMA